MYEDKMDNPWFQKMALLETLSDEEKIGLYSKEFPMILQCSKLPDKIVQRVLSKEATILEQLSFLRNKFVSDDVMKILYENTPYESVRKWAHENLYEKEKISLQGLEIIRKLSAN